MHQVSGLGRSALAAELVRIHLVDVPARNPNIVQFSIRQSVQRGFGACRFAPVKDVLNGTAQRRFDTAGKTG